MRLTQEQAAYVDSDAYDTLAEYPNLPAWVRGETRLGNRCHTGNSSAWACRVADLLDQLRDTTARAEQAEIDADEMDRKMCVLVLGKQQAEKDRDALAAEVRAWRAFDAACGVRDRIAYTAALRPVHPIDTMKATDASGALQRAKGGAA